MEQLKELSLFLGHDNPAVVQQAMQILSGFTSETKHMKAIASSDVIKYLIRHITSSISTIVTTSLTCLVNLSQHDHYEITEQLMKYNVIDVLIEVLRDITFIEVELALMLLTNISRHDCKSVMQEDTNIKGLHVRRLITWLDRKGKEYDYIASILLNCSKLESFQSLLLKDNAKLLLKYIIPQLLTKSILRQEYLFLLMRNLFINSDNLDTLMTPNNHIYEYIILPIIGPGKFDQEDIDVMPTILQEAVLDKSSRRTKTEGIRTAILDIIALICQKRIYRQLLRSQSIYYIVRELHNELKELEIDAHEDIIIDLVHYFQMDDPEMKQEQVSVKEIEDNQESVTEIDEQD